MDNIWYRNPSKSEVISRCYGDEKPNDHAEPTKVQKQTKKPSCLILTHNGLRLALNREIMRIKRSTINYGTSFKQTMSVPIGWSLWDVKCCFKLSDDLVYYLCLWLFTRVIMHVTN